MIRSLWIAKTGMEGQQTKLDTISNNLANVGTNGYKRGGVVFEDLMYQNLRQTGSPPAPNRACCPPACRSAWACAWPATTRNFAQGTLQQTSSDFDVAIKGKGFFQITLPDGTTGYTRDGSFQVDANGQLVTSATASRCSRASPSRRRAEGHDRADGTVNVTLSRPGRAAGRGQITAGQLHQPGRPGAARAEPVCRERVVGRAAGRRTRAANGLGSCSRAWSRAATSTWSRSWSR
jgi:flagellar basal-body rod protein FlgG